jgi:K+-sensing histidine kinase KdpD
VRAGVNDKWGDCVMLTGRKEKLEQLQLGVRERWVGIEDRLEGVSDTLKDAWLWMSDRPTIMRWSIVVLSIAASILIGLIFRQYVTVGSQLMLFLPAVLLSSLYGGWITGTAASLLGACASLYYYFWSVDVALVARHGDLTVADHYLLARQNYVALLLYGLACCMVIGLSQAQEYHRRKAGELAKTLEDRVQERTSELQAAHRELAEFCYSISHDLRAPMRNIIGTSKIMLEDTEVSSDVREGLESMAASATRLSKLVDDLLKYARLNETRIQPEWVDLTKLSDEICHQLAKRRWPFASMSWSIEPGLVVGADPILCSLVLQALLENASKYAKKESSLSIRVGEKRLRGKTWFYVQDNGIGLDMQYAAKIFEPFQKLHRDVESAGTGIGLANVKRIVERHGGEIFVESELGEGSTFYFNFGGIEPSAPRPSSNTVEARKVIFAEEA